jgi:hypothetical protein
MKQALLGGLALAAALVGVAPSAPAQVRGLPVANPGVPRGIGVYGDVGFSNDDAGGGTAYGITGKAGLGVIGFTGTLASYDPDAADASITVGATVNYRVFGGPLVPLAVTLQGGIGYFSPDTDSPFDFADDELHFPVGLGFALTIPNPVLAIRPWLAPRLDLTSRKIERGDRDTDANFALSGGLELNTLGGFGVHATYDAIFADGGTPGVFGIGAHYTFRVPGL